MSFELLQEAILITKEVDYALRALLYLAQNSSSASRLSAATISEKMEIPYRFLRNIISILSDSGFIESKRGNGGGLCLAMPAEQFSLYDVMQAVNPKSCVLNTCLMGKNCCSRDSHCPVHNKLTKVQKIVNDQLKEIKFNQFINTKDN